MLTIILLVAALVLFVLATFGVPSKANLTAAGLACVTLALILRMGLLNG